MRVLVIGSGAREHALVLALQRDANVSDVAAAPGNPGIAEIASCTPVNATDGTAVAAHAASWGADLVVIGPEAPLVAGVADAVRDGGIACFGPSHQAARLEGSKAFAKEIMAACGVPTARAHVCTTSAEVTAALDSFGAPYVVKDDGLAAGKGVVVTEDVALAQQHAETCLDRPGAQVVIEEYLDGPEVSLFCITDGTTILPLAPAQDFKRLRDGDAGPNTGGMGAYCPLPWAPSTLVKDVVARVAEPTITTMRERGTPFAGLLYIGLALTATGPRVVEFNARFGDPETQVILPLLDTPLGAVLYAAATGSLADVGPLRWSSDAAVGVVLAAPGYPESPQLGNTITGLSDANATPRAHVVHAGTANSPTESDSVISAGGRVLTVVGTGGDLTAARDVTYSAMRRIALPGGQFRNDIAAQVDFMTIPERTSGRDITTGSATNEDQS
ncbi:MAG: phosphoribosylamine--glycine ligase [Actinomycetota bacterium]